MTFHLHTLTIVAFADPVFYIFVNVRPEKFLLDHVKCSVTLIYV